MLFSGSLRQRVDPSARAVGAALVAQKAVAIVAVVPPGDVHAEVHDDGALEDVVVSYDGSRFGFSCTCSMFEDGDNVCAHVWAVVLESENNLPDAFLGHDLSGELPQRTGQLWKRVLQQIGRSTRSQAVQTRATSLDQPERVLYVLDGPETRESGDLTLRTFVQKLTRTGRWGSPKPRRVRSERISELVDTLDRRLWSLLSPTAEDSPRRYWSYYDRQRESDNSVALSVDVAEVLFPILVETGRFFFSDSERLEEWRELSFDTDDRAWSLSLRVERDGGEWKLSGFLRRGSDAMTLAEPWLLLASGWVVNDGKLGRLDDHGAFAWIPALRVHEAIRFAERDAEEFLTAVWNNSQLPPIDWPEELRLEEITQDPRPRLWLETCEEDPRKHRKLRARLGFDYGDVTIVDGHGSDSILDLEYRTRTVRDHDREANFRRKLLDAGFEPPPQHLVRREVFGPFELQLAPKRLSAAVASLANLVIAAISTSCSIGFVGVSIQSNLVRSLSTASTLLKSDISTKWLLIPNFP